MRPNLDLSAKRWTGMHGSHAGLRITEEIIEKVRPRRGRPNRDGEQGCQDFQHNAGSTRNPDGSVRSAKLTLEMRRAVTDAVLPGMTFGACPSAGGADARDIPLLH
jgi:hypothetical protein